MADDASPSLADQINNALTPVSDAVSSVIFYSVTIAGVSLPLVVVWLISAAIFLTVSLGFVNLRGFRHAWRLVLNPRADHSGEGEISHFEALSSALSGTVGLGNIASVPVAIALGGPGAVFWMIVAGFFGMTTKFAECALAVKYRKIGEDGRVFGGPMYYIEMVFSRHGLKTVGKIAAVFFAVMTIGGSMSLFQVNQSYAQFNIVTGIEAPIVYGVIMASLVAVVILGGIKKIASVTRVLVPFMGAIYLLAALAIVALNVTAMPDVIAMIFKSAFGLEAAGGGFVGALINGIQRATYSSEAGVGSAAIAHAAVRTKEPLTEGYVALLEPFIDTIVVCTITALVILSTGVYEPFLYAPKSEIIGIEMTSAAFAGAFSWFPYVLLVAVILFAFSTLMSWAYYGAQAAAYLFGATKRVDVIFKLTLCFILSTGAAVSLSSILDFIDSMLFGMAIPNIIALYLLMPELRRDIKTYEGSLKSPAPKTV
ncbi:MAG: alanine/glycine:cation symporter family protein [Pseudomonadota bacterium]